MPIFPSFPFLEHLSFLVRLNETMENEHRRRRSDGGGSCSAHFFLQSTLLFCLWCFPQMSPEVTDIAAGRILNFGLFFSHMQPSLEFSTFRFFLLAFLPLPPLLFQELPGEFGTFYLLFFSPFGLAKIIVDCPIIESVFVPNSCFC